MNNFFFKTGLLVCICCGSILSLVQISFLLFQTNYHVIIIHYHTQKLRKRKFEPRIKLNHNIYMCPFCFIRFDVRFFFCIYHRKRKFLLCKMLKYNFLLYTFLYYTFKPICCTLLLNTFLLQTAKVYTRLFDIS